MQYFSHTNVRLSNFQFYWHKKKFEEAIEAIIDSIPFIDVNNISIDNPLLSISSKYQVYSNELNDFCNKVSLMMTYNKNIECLSQEEILGINSELGKNLFDILSAIKTYKERLSELDYHAAGETLVVIQRYGENFFVEFAYFLFSWIIDQSQKHFIYPHRKKFMPRVLRFFIWSLNSKYYSDDLPFISENEFILDELTLLLLRYFDIRKPNQKHEQSELIKILTDTVYELKMGDKLLSLMRDFDNPYNTNPKKIIEIAYHAKNEYSLYFCIDRLREFIRRYRYEPIWEKTFEEAKIFLVEILNWIADSLDSEAYRKISFEYMFDQISVKFDESEIISKLEEEFSKGQKQLKSLIEQNPNDKISHYKRHEVIDLLKSLSNLKTDIARMPYGKEFREELLDHEEKCLMYQFLPLESYMDSLEEEIEKLKSKVVSLEIKKVREKYIEKLEVLDENSEEYEFELKELLSEVNIIVERKMKNQKYDTVKEVEKKLREKLDEVNTNLWTSLDDTTKNQLLIGELLFKQFEETESTIKQYQNKLEVRNLEYSSPALPFTKALEHVLFRFFIKEFGEYCIKNNESMPYVVQDILDPNNKAFFSLGKLRSILSDTHYFNLSRNYFNTKFKGRIVHPYKRIRVTSETGKSFQTIDNSSFKLLNYIDDISKYRNRVAHKEGVNFKAAKDIRRKIVGLDQVEMSKGEFLKFRNKGIIIELLNDVR